MEFLTFDKFAKILYPFCGNGETKPQFIKTLTNKIMTGRPGAARGTEQYGNPMIIKSNRTLQAYFQGTRFISQRDASIIFKRIDAYRFEEYLRRQCSEGALMCLKADLDKYLGTELGENRQDVPAACADLFIDILHRLSSGKAS